MEGDRKEALLSTAPRPLPPSQTMPHKQKSHPANPDTLQILFPAGFDLIVLSRDLRLNHSCTPEWVVACQEMKGAGFYRERPEFHQQRSCGAKTPVYTGDKVLSFPPETAIGCCQLFGNII